MTLKERFIIALQQRGEVLVKKNFKHDVYSRKAGGYYYVGRSGALRFGPSVTASHPVSNAFKKLLIGE